MIGTWSNPSPSETDTWKILEHYKFFTARSVLDDSIDVSIKQLNEVIGEAGQPNETSTSDEDYIYDINEYAHYAEDSENTTQQTSPSSQWTDFSSQKMIVTKTSQASLSPLLKAKQLRNIETFASIHLDANVLTWASFRIDRSSEIPTISVLNWDNAEFVIERMKFWQLLCEVDALLRNVPKCDAYVIENLASSTFRSNTKKVNELLLMSQYFSVTASLLAARNPANSYAENPNVIFMARDLSGKFHRLYIGKETVSTQNLVKTMISGTNSNISFAKEMVGSFRTASIVKREYLSRTTLIGITFFRMGVMGDKIIKPE